MLMQRRRTFKHTFGTGCLLLAVLAGRQSAANETIIDLLQDHDRNWLPSDAKWAFGNDEISGRSGIMDGAITDPAASTFLVSKRTFGGDIVVTMDVTFDTGRYLGVYLDFDQDTQSGIWMATGHALAADAADNEVERAYIKTVAQSFWVVRATGELVAEPGSLLRLRFVRKGDVYSIWNDETLIVTYHKAGGYPAGPLQIRLTNASAHIHRLEVEADRID